ncbi:MAG: NAD(P)-binding domain-containing protein [Oscillospiraceae bacterium]|nr:NAD(P)-binding domain-containing protein [Oscillospiraceae bacterium]
MKFGIIGYGNLGKAFASALICTGEIPACDISVYDSSEAALTAAKKESFNIYSADGINEMIKNTDIICIIVKSYVFEELAKNMDQSILKEKLVISMMAGVTFEQIYSLIGQVSLARVMPSIAIATNEGVIAYTKLPEKVSVIFGKFGYAFETEPGNLEKATAFASCGFGFAAYLIDAFAKAGEKMGFPPETASHIAALTFKNASGSSNFRETVKAVATPGGATEQGINHMDSNNIYEIVAEAMQKSYKHVT